MIFAHIMHMQETGLGSGEPTYHNPEELNFHVRELASTYMYEATYELIYNATYFKYIKLEFAHVHTTPIFSTRRSWVLLADHLRMMASTPKQGQLVIPALLQHLAHWMTLTTRPRRMR